MKKLLITVSDERLLLKGFQYCLLSESCLLNFSEDFSSQKFDIYPPYGIDKTQKDQDRLLSDKIESQLFTLIIPILNKFHNKDFDYTQWKIILGKWLRRYVDLLINRYSTLQFAILNQQFDKIPILNIKDYDICSNDSLDFVLKSNDPEWNHMVFQEIIQYSFTNNVELITIDSYSKKNIVEYYQAPVGLKSKLKKVVRLLFTIYSNLIKNKKIFILNSYLTALEDFFIQLKSNDLPAKYFPIRDYLKNATDHNLRLMLSEQLVENLVLPQPIFALCVKNIFKFLPKCFLEDFKSIEERILSSTWPKNPKIIFTSNHFDFDEVFKLYTALKVKNETKYVIGQHGNNYGTYRYMYHTNEETTSSAFLTWGWKGDLDNQVPCFIFKRTKNRNFKYNRNGNILLIQLPLMNQFETWDLVYEHRLYFENQLDFVSKLPTNLFDRLVIRLHRDFKFQNWNEPSRWKNQFKNINLDMGTVPISKLTKSAKLVIHSYDSTGLLETLYSNIPTMAFWLNGYDHLQDKVIDDYKVLEDVGIIHLNNNSLISFIQNNWDRLDLWWTSDKVQNAREFFCSKYAVHCANPINKISGIFCDLK